MSRYEMDRKRHDDCGCSEKIDKVVVKEVIIKDDKKDHDKFDDLLDLLKKLLKEKHEKHHNGNENGNGCEAITVNFNQATHVVTFFTASGGTFNCVITPGTTTISQVNACLFSRGFKLIASDIDPGANPQTPGNVGLITNQYVRC